jgi:hypothetical protein
MHYKEMGSERYREISSDINSLNNSVYVMTIAEIMCDNEGPSFMFSYDKTEIDEQIAKCNITEPSKPRKQLPYSTVDGNIKRYTTIATGPMKRGGKRKMHKTASKRKSNGKKTVHRATKRRVHTRKHGNKKNKRHVKKHTKRA